MFQLKFSLKFYLGIIFIILSLVVGNLTKILFFLYFNEVSLRLVWAVIYLMSWPVLFWGIWLAGSEMYANIRKYFTYRFYKEHLKEGTQKAYYHTQKLKEKVKKRIKNDQNPAPKREPLNNQELLSKEYNNNNNKL